MQHIDDNYYSQRFNIIIWVTVSQKNYIPSMLANDFDGTYIVIVYNDTQNWFSR